MNPNREEALFRAAAQLRGAERSAFLGEQSITAAILNVASATRKKIYFLYGHSELRPDDPDPG